MTGALSGDKYHNSTAMSAPVQSVFCPLPTHNDSLRWRFVSTICRGSRVQYTPVLLLTSSCYLFKQPLAQSNTGVTLVHDGLLHSTSIGDSIAFGNSPRNIEPNTIDRCMAQSKDAPWKGTSHHPSRRLVQIKTNQTWQGS